MDRSGYEALQQETILRLRVAAAPLPKHAAFLETLLGARIENLWAVEPRGVGAKAAEALRTDVEWCLRPPVLTEEGQVDHGDSRNRFSYTYENLRLDQIRRARARRLAKQQSGPEILRDLLSF